MTELEKLTGIFNSLCAIDEKCRKAKTMQMQLIITRDAISVIKATLARHIYDLTGEMKEYD